MSGSFRPRYCRSGVVVEFLKADWQLTESGRTVQRSSQVVTWRLAAVQPVCKRSEIGNRVGNWFGLKAHLCVTQPPKPTMPEPEPRQPQKVCVGDKCDVKRWLVTKLRGEFFTAHESVCEFAQFVGKGGL